MQNVQRTQTSPIHRLDLPDARFAEAFRADDAPRAADKARPAADGSFARLVSCHVEDFGKLHDQQFDFEPGLNVIEAANGVGKTTLANFVRAMFYGFDDEAAQQGRQDLRERYRPWQGGTYGGQMVFEGRSGAYRVERTFGRTSQEDTLAVCELGSGRHVEELERGLGERLFGMDADSFERSTYVARLSGPHTRPTQRMLAKLTGTPAPQEEPSPSAQDQVAARHAQLCRLSREYADEAHAIEGLFGADAPSPEVAQELAQALEDVRRADEADADRADEGLAVRDFIARTEQRFPQGLPGEEEVARRQRQLSELAAVRAQEGSRGLSPAESARLAELERTFAQGVPGAGELERCQQVISQLDRLAGTLKGLGLSGQEAQRMQVLEGYFAPGVPSDEEIRRCRALLASAQTMRTMDTAQLATAEARTSGAAKALAGVGGVLVAAGLVVAVVLYLPVPGAVTAIAGGVALAVAALLALLGKGGSSKRAGEAAGQTQRSALALESQARAFTARYARDAEPDKAVEAIARLKAEHAALQARLDSSRQQRAEIEEEARPLRDEVEAFLGTYLPERAAQGNGDKEAPQQALARLQGMVETRKRLVQARDAAGRRAQEDRERAEALEGQLLDFLRPYYPDVDVANAASLLSNLAGTVSAYGQAQRMLGDAADMQVKRQAKADEARMRLREVCARHGWDPEHADETFAQRLAQGAARYPVIQAQTEAVRAQLRELVATYGPPPYGPATPAASEAVERGFASYIERFSGIAPSGVDVDATSGAVVRQQGRTHQIAELSQGYSDVIAFCMRMALGDALFEGAKPFIILDDPFVNLDDRHLSEALAFVEDLAADRQIVYLTCHSSRAM